jgi:hypothetical protein
MRVGNQPAGEQIAFCKAIPGAKKWGRTAGVRPHRSARSTSSLLSVTRVRMIPWTPLSRGESRLTSTGGFPLLSSTACCWRPGSVRGIDYKTRVIRCSLWAGQGLITLPGPPFCPTR